MSTIRTPPGLKTKKVQFERLPKADLVNECEKLGLPTQGTIAELRLRLREHSEVEEFELSATPDKLGGQVEKPETDLESRREGLRQGDPCVGDDG